MTNLLDDISDKFEKIPESKREQLQEAYEPCFAVLAELDQLLNHYNSLDTRTKRTWDRLKYDPEKTRSIRDRLTSSVTMLNSFYTSMIHDSQVLILEALERLERDYAGGHREESIASLGRITSGSAEEDEEADEAAWSQILRDLEDVGVAKQDALGYRDVIVDWLVKAVNEGRLLEQSEEPDAFDNMAQDLRTALPWEEPGTHSLDVPPVLASYERSHSASFPIPPVFTPPEIPHQRAQSVPSTVAPSVPDASATSSNAASTEETDTSSLYAAPEPVPRIPPANFTTNVPRRVPVPIRPVEPPQTFISSESFGTTFLPPPSIPSASVSASASVTDLSAPIYSPTPARTPPPIPPKTPVPPAATFPPPTTAPSAPETTVFLQQPQALYTTTSFSNAPISAAALAPEPAQYPQAQSAPPLLQTPPSYYDKEDTLTADLAWTSQQIVAAWSRKDYTVAGNHLEDQLAAVDRGHRVIATGLQPDRRILRHLLGVANALAGNFEKAKRYFEGVFNGPYLNRPNFDDGDIAAARWLGDCCLHLREHSNALLAWGVAYEASLGRYGVARDRTRRIGEEIRLLDHWLFAFRRIEISFQNNVDPTDIFQQSHAIEKSNLIATLRVHIYETRGYGPTPIPPPNLSLPPYYTIGGRPRLELGISEGFLLAPLISLSSWPFPWDATFSPADACQLDRNMNTVRTATTIIPLVQRTLPTLSLGASKNLHYATKRGSVWLIETVKKALQELCVEHAEHMSDTSVVCTLNQHREGMAFSEGVKITFKKLPLRNIYGIHVTNVLWSTRFFGIGQPKDTSDFRDILKGILELSENEAGSWQTNVPTPPVPPPGGYFNDYR